MAQENEQGRAARKELPIRSHDTAATRGRRTVRQRTAERTLRMDARRPEGEGLDQTTREALEALVAQEAAKGQKHRARASSKMLSASERSALKARATTDPLAQLKLDTLAAGEAYMDSLKKSGIVAPDKSAGRKEKQGVKLTGLHQTYAQMMAMSALGPLRQGISAPAVVQTLGMTSAMFLLSPNFRSVVKGLRPDVLGAVKGRIAARREKQEDKALDKLERAESRGKGKSSLSSKWQKRLDRVERAERGHRDPFTAHSAGLTEVALLESAYAAMRDPRVSAERREAHIAEVRESLESAMSALNDHIAADGLDREEVSREARTIVGHRLAAESELASVFAETGHGRFVRSPAKQMFVVGETEPREVWAGGFTDAVTDREVTHGSFALRPPANRGEHVVLCARTLEAELEDATTLGELNDMFASYTAASVIRRFPGMSAEVEDPEVRSRMGRAEAMFSSMRADGISQTDQRYVYAAAFVQAMEGVGEKNPELIAQWEAQYGPDWRDNVQEAVQHYSDLGQRVEKKRLVDALVERGYDRAEASAEVDSYQQGADENSPQAVGTDEPDAPGDLDAEREELLDQGYQIPPLPEGLTAQQRALSLVDSMSDYIRDDLLAEDARKGFYSQDGTQLGLDDPGDGTEQWVEGAAFMDAAHTDWASGLGGSQAALPEGPGSDDRTLRGHRRRSAALAQMHQAAEAMGFPQKTRDAMVAAAYARGLQKASVSQPSIRLAMHGAEVQQGGDGTQWLDRAYRRAMEGTPAGTAFRRDRAAALEGVAEAQRDEVMARWADRDPSRGGYAAWERQFDKLDSVSIPGVSKVGELDTAGPDTVRDQVSTEAEKLGTDASGSDRERRIRIKRNQRIKDRINQDYNKGPSTGRITGLGRDETQILQGDDPTLGY